MDRASPCLFFSCVLLTGLALMVSAEYSDRSVVFRFGDDGEIKMNVSVEDLQSRDSANRDMLRGKCSCPTVVDGADMNSDFEGFDVGMNVFVSGEKMSEGADMNPSMESDCSLCHENLIAVESRVIAQSEKLPSQSCNGEREINVGSLQSDEVLLDVEWEQNGLSLPSGLLLHNEAEFLPVSGIVNAQRSNDDILITSGNFVEISTALEDSISHECGPDVSDNFGSIDKEEEQTIMVATSETLNTEVTKKIDEKLITEETKQIDDKPTTDETKQIDGIHITEETKQIDETCIHEEIKNINEIAGLAELDQPSLIKSRHAVSYGVFLTLNLLSLFLTK